MTFKLKKNLIKFHVSFYRAITEVNIGEKTVSEKTMFKWTHVNLNSLLKEKQAIKEMFTQVTFSGVFYPVNPFPNGQILDSSKLKEFADDNFKYDENGREFSK